jgi:hypothetical protein
VNLHVSHVWLQQSKASSHPPSTICLFPISPSLSLPLQTLRLVSAQSRQSAQLSQVVGIGTPPTPHPQASVPFMHHTGRFRAPHNFYRCKFIFCLFFDGLECVGHSFAYVAYFVFLRKCMSGFEPRELP